MTDSVAVFPPGFVLTHEGEPIDGYVEFKDAAYSGTRTVYSTSDLSTTSLGSTVYLSSGVPVASEGSNTPVMVYIGTAVYSMIVKDNDDATLLALDNIEGAPDTSTFLTTGSTSTLSIPVVATAIDLTLTAAHRGKLINATGSPTITLTSALTLGDNWNSELRNGGSGLVAITASQNIATPMGATTAFVLRPGEGCTLRCNGSSFQAIDFSPPLLSGTVGVIAITDRITAAPASPTAGARYIVATGFSTYATHDIIEANGQGGFITITPVADCGWLAYVLDENLVYQFVDSAWAKLIDATSLTGTLGTYTALASTATTITGISATAKRVTLNIVGMSWNNTAALRIRIGPSGGVATSGYLSVQTYLESDTTAAVVAGTAGIDFTSFSATCVFQGSITFTLADAATNTWVYSGVLGVTSANTSVLTVGGSVALSGVLDRITLSTIAGTATVDAGSISLLVQSHA